jgi:hypothetical protein
VNQGTYTIIFNFSSGVCEGSIQQTITVKGKEEISFNPLPDLCKNRVIDLTQYVFPTGGEFSGQGVVNGKFYPETVGTGEYIVTYSYTNELGCKTTSQASINVVELLEDGTQFKVLPDVCIDSQPLLLKDYITNSNEGKFTGAGVEGNYFNPSQAGTGAWTISYEIGNAQNCKELFKQTIVVHSNDSVVFASLPSSCTNKLVNLEDYVSHKGGTFNGPGVENGQFDPLKAGSGDHLIVYEYKSHSGCESTLTKTIHVPKIYPSVTFSEVSELCENSGSINLAEYVNVSGGAFSGQGIEDNSFSPSLAGPGTHTIEYVLGNEECSVRATQTITVIGVPEIEFNELPSICFNELLRLSDYISHPGDFSGTGVTGQFFNPFEAGVGTHQITYYYMQNGCEMQIKKSVEVLSLNSPMVEFSAIEAQCVNSPAIDLSLYTSANGAFSGPGVEGNLFYPDKASSGTHEIVLSVGNNSCERSYHQFITVYGKTPLSLLDDIQICNGQEVNLNNYVNIQGGIFSGSGVTGHFFYPEKLGSYPVKYSYENKNGCVSELSFIVDVSGMQPEDIQFTSINEICEDVSEIDLREYVNFYSSNSSTFSGNGVTSYYFSPSDAGVGIHEIIYEVGQGACKSILKQTVKVNGLTNVELSLPETICKDQFIDLQNYVNVEGGIFKGEGINSNVLQTSSAGVGEHKVSFEYSNSNGCTTKETQLINILSLNPDNVIFDALQDVCENDGHVRLTDYVSDASLARFSGKGVSGYYFSPSQAGEGTHMISCKIGLVSGCVDEYQQIINVLPLPDAQISSLPSICFNEEIDLSSYVNIQGGTFYGKGVTGSYFDPETAEKGIHKIGYIIQNKGGCETIVESTIEVKTLYSPEIEFAPIDEMCFNEGTINLSNKVSHFVGTFSGPGVSGSTFNPAIANIGTHAITYSVGESSCQREFIQYVTIYPQTDVEFSAIPMICQDREINLVNYIDQPGGIFSGVPMNEEGIVLTANLDIGNYIIDYEYTDGNGCVTITQQTLFIKGHNPVVGNVEFSSIPEICNGSAAINLSDYASPQGGRFSGPGVTGNLFSSSQAGEGSHRIAYSAGEGDCNTVLYQYINVTPSKNVEFSNIGKICDTTSIDLSQYVNYKGGIFSGPGVNGNMLSPKEAGKGIHRISYVFDDDLCRIELSQEIEVLNVKEVLFHQVLWLNFQVKVLKFKITDGNLAMVDILWRKNHSIITIIQGILMSLFSVRILTDVNML